MKVENVMVGDGIACPADATLDKVAALMRDSGIGTVAVVSAAGRLAGVISDRDVAMAALQTNARLSDIGALAIARASIETCTPDADIVAVEARMQTLNTRTLPVVDPAGRLVGMLSLDTLDVGWRQHHPTAGAAPAPSARPPVDANQVRVDVWEALARSAAVDSTEIEVDVEGPAVRLRGAVTDPDQARLAVQIAATVAGGRRVIDELRVESNLVTETTASGTTVESTTGHFGVTP